MERPRKRFFRREPTNWIERGIDSWVGEIESECELASKNHLIDYNHLIETYLEPGRIYFSLAARSRAKACGLDEREEIDGCLFLARTLIENSMAKAISHNLEPFLNLIFKKGFFGCSIKQGVTVRFPLSSCNPTQKCGGGCYAHDGRDKHLGSIARGVFNYLAIRELEKIIDRGIASHYLSNFYSQIDKAIVYSMREAMGAALAGFSRRPRIRLSHVGELAAYPEMANWLASQISERSSGKVDSVIYTRHPNASKLRTDLMVVNFTVESNTDKRGIYAPAGSHLVASSWGGRTYESVSVNFLEHHGKNNFKMKGNGKVCPVTLSHELTSTCDLAKCSLCFTNHR